MLREKPFGKIQLVIFVGLISALEGSYLHAGRYLGRIRLHTRDITVTQALVNTGGQRDGGLLECGDHNRIVENSRNLVDAVYRGDYVGGDALDHLDGARYDVLRAGYARR